MPSWPTKLFTPSSSAHAPERSATPPRLHSIFPQLEVPPTSAYGHQRSKSHVPPGISNKNVLHGGEQVTVAPFGAIRRERTIANSEMCDGLRI
ncbi:hypothetical protein DRE_03233 [Drechslerella stenobrocha 248]|uniref:Uncharacterized protein n=1 Tax=Drechslerella stenobrocha 248 TaxID=1043628 RepID=W7I636_9PEZI|nr:hypothetical protein DRE_03233 [Drechslerella stenobrocha 248]